MEPAEVSMNNTSTTSAGKAESLANCGSGLPYEPCQLDAELVLHLFPRQTSYLSSRVANVVVALWLFAAEGYGRYYALHLLALSIHYQYCSRENRWFGQDQNPNLELKP